MRKYSIKIKLLFPTYNVKRQRVKNTIPVRKGYKIDNKQNIREGRELKIYKINDIVHENEVKKRCVI